MFVAVVAASGCYDSFARQPTDETAAPLCAVDEDGDGYCAPEDCDDADRRIHPGAVEPCHPYYADFDCDGLTTCNDLDCLTSGLCP